MAMATTQCPISYFSFRGWAAYSVLCVRNKVNMFNLKHFTNCAQFKQKFHRKCLRYYAVFVVVKAAGDNGNTDAHACRTRATTKLYIPVTNFNLLIHVFLNVLCAKFTFS